MFLDQGWNLHTDFKHYVRQILVYGDFFVRNLDASVGGAPPVPVAFTEEVFSFLNRMVPFLSP